MKWATWENVGIDRMGCAWLIRTRIDPEATFTFVPEGSRRVPEDVEAFDIPGVRFSHRGGHSSFHTLVREHRLDDPILLRIAQIIDDADTVQEGTLEPAAAGVDLICRGLRLVSKDDHMALERGALVYDALYAQLREDERRGSS